jgi:hypothetical protein
VVTFIVGFCELVFGIWLSILNLNSVKYHEFSNSLYGYSQSGMFLILMILLLPVGFGALPDPHLLWPLVVASMDFSVTNFVFVYLASVVLIAFFEYLSLLGSYNWAVVKWFFDYLDLKISIRVHVDGVQ